MWVALKAGADVTEIVREIYAIRNLTIVAVSSAAPLKAAQLLREHRLKPRDAIHVATMQEYDIRTIVSEDTDFDRVPGITRIAF
jgi:predicted nucleic acid-binding protein